MYINETYEIGRKKIEKDYTDTPSHTLVSWQPKAPKCRKWNPMFEIGQYYTIHTVIDTLFEFIFINIDQIFRNHVKVQKN